MHALFLLPLVAASASASALASYTCTSAVIPVKVSANTTVLNLKAPADQVALTGLITDMATGANATYNTGNKTILNASYNINSQLCVPRNFPANGTLEFAIHGVVFDQQYWTFGGKGSDYNYVEAAIKANHAIFIYDRLGAGKSSKPDGIHAVQLSTEVEVAAGLLKYLRKGVNHHTFGKVVVVGHSYGSFQTVALATRHHELVDAVVLTGFSLFATGIVPAGMDYTIADRKRFPGSSDNSYITPAGKTNVQLVFLHYPNFTTSTLETAYNTQATLTLGQLITLTEGAAPALNYTGPVFVVTGENDYIFCSGNCKASVNGSADLLTPASVLFPRSNYTTYMPPATGHGLNVHLSAPKTFGVIQSWIKTHGF